MMAILFKKSLKIGAINLFFGFFASGVSAQSLSDIVIPLDLGQWDHSQSTYFSGIHMPLFDLKGTECVTESEANLTLQDYADKLMAGLNVGRDGGSCDISNVDAKAGKVEFDLLCTDSAGGSTKLHFVYKHTRVLAVFEGSGTVIQQGHSIPIRIEGKTARTGECVDEE